MGEEVAAEGGVGDERAELGVLDGDLGEADPAAGVGFEEGFDEAVVARLRGVGDVGEDGVLEVVVDGADDLGHEGAAEGAAFAVDVGVVAARKVDALEDAAAGRGLGEDALDGDVAVAQDDDGVAGREFGDVGGGDVERGLDGDALGGDDGDLVVEIVVGGADAGGVAQSEGVAVAEGAADDEAAVPFGGGGAEEGGDVAAFQAVVRGGHLLEAVGEQGEEDFAVLTAAEVVSAFDEFVEERAGVGEVEVAGEQERVVAPRAVADERVAGGEGAGAEGAVAEVAEIEFAAEGEGEGLALGERFGGDAGVFSLGGGEPFAEAGEEVVEGGLGAGALDLVERPAGGGVEADAGDAGAVLPAVVLFLEEEGELLVSVVGRAVLAGVVGEVAAEPEERHAAFVLDVVRHGRVWGPGRIRGSVRAD